MWVLHASDDRHVTALHRTTRLDSTRRSMSDGPTEAIVDEKMLPHLPQNDLDGGCPHHTFEDRKPDSNGWMQKNAMAVTQMVELATEGLPILINVFVVSYSCLTNDK